jgi:Domain of unknown function (DUF4397)
LKRSLLLLLIGAFAIFVNGCGDDNSQARLRIVHDSPDAPNVDVLVNGSTIATNVAYKSASDYLSVPSGATRIQVRPTGSNTDVIDANPTIDEKKDYTVLATNFVASLEPLVLTDDNAPPASGKVKLRLVHGAPSAPAVDIYVTAPGADINPATATLTNIPFKAASDYLSVDAGSYQVRVTPTGTKTVVIDSGTLSLVAGQIRTAIAVDNTGGGAPFGAIILNDLN